jgi:hypothetical protein
MTPADCSPREPHDAEDLVVLAGVFPAFRLWREDAFSGPRYVAQGRSLATRPHTLVTGDLAELRAALISSRQATA